MRNFKIYKNTELLTEVHVTFEDTSPSGREVFEISFMVDGDFDRNGSSRSIAITRWLLQTWKQVKLDFKGSEMRCEAHDEDGYGWNRLEMYQKLGFSVDCEFEMSTYL